MQDSQQLLVQDSNDSGALQAVGGSAALALLESVWQSLDVVPFTKILQRQKRAESSVFINEAI